MVLKNYEGALEDLNKINILKPNNAFTLTLRGRFKYLLDD